MAKIDKECQRRPMLMAFVYWCPLVLFVAVLTAGTVTGDDVVPETQDAEPIELIDESDVSWSVDEFGRGHVHLSGASAELRGMDDPPLDRLAAIRDEPAQFIPAFVVLHELMEVRRGFHQFMTDDGWQLEYHGLKVLLRRDEDGDYSATYPNIENVMSFLEYIVPYNAALRMEWMLKDTPAAEEANPVRPLSLIGRTRDGIDEIVNEDVRWRIRSLHAIPGLSGASFRVSRSAPSVEALMESLTDPGRFIAAHIVLTRQFGGDGFYSGTTPDSILAYYNGLHLEITWSRVGDDGGGKWNVEYPQLERQQEILLHRWRNRLVVRSLP